MADGLHVGDHLPGIVMENASARSRSRCRSMACRSPTSPPLPLTRALDCRAQNSVQRARSSSSPIRLQREIIERLEFLNAVGLSYLSLDRNAATLSGGEGQRIRLATQIGSRLRGVLYVLDEPSIGLHQRDNQRLIEALDLIAESRQHRACRRAR